MKRHEWRRQSQKALLLPTTKAAAEDDDDGGTPMILFARRLTRAVMKGLHRAPKEQQG
jgi:hypothetical protein